jgi:hypothetical protein
MMMAVELDLQSGNVTDVAADVLLLKYAQGRFGADEVVAETLVERGICSDAEIRPKPWEAAVVETRDVIAPKRVIFLGVPNLRGFRYREMRQFARQAMEVIRRGGFDARTLTTTVHGSGYGLDSEEAMQSLVFGFQQGLADGPVDGLSRITFVELNHRRADLLARALGTLPPRIVSASTPAPPAEPSPPPVPKPPDKKRVFVAMAFSKEFEDVYQFGIYDVVRRCGYVCERIDEAALAGSIVDQITDGIRNAEFVIADLSGERPNVYLEVGFAWGINRQVLLPAREQTRLHFDLSHHKCIFYKTIKQLARDLEDTIKKLAAKQCPE